MVLLAKKMLCKCLFWAWVVYRMASFYLLLRMFQILTCISSNWKNQNKYQPINTFYFNNSQSSSMNQWEKHIKNKPTLFILIQYELLSNYYIRAPMDPLQQLKKKYPVLQYFKNIEGINQQSLGILANQIHLTAKEMSPQCKMILKKIRQFASKAEVKLKNGRKLYKFLHNSEDLISQIILNNEKLKSVQALQNRSYKDLSQLQLSNNEIDDLTPLQSLLAPTLQQIDLSSNAIAILRPINLCNWNQLIALNISQNKISSIDNIRFSRFQKIKVLNLSDNFITRIKYLRKQLNANLKHLRTLDLSFNYILDLWHLSQCNFVDLRLINAENNYSAQIFQVQKLCLNLQDKHMAHKEYEIRLSTGWQRDSSFLYRFRQKSKHKLAVKIQKDNYRADRSINQKGRRLIFD